MNVMTDETPTHPKVLYKTTVFYLVKVRRKVLIKFSQIINKMSGELQALRFIVLQCSLLQCVKKSNIEISDRHLDRVSLKFLAEFES